jgi:hypothetical protein
MTSTMRYVALFLIATGAFAQHSGGFAGRPAPGLGSTPAAAGFGRVPLGIGGTGVFPRFPPGPRIRSAFGPGAFGNRFGYGNRSGYGYFAPYYPFYGYGYDQSLGGYPEEYPAGGNTFVFPPTANTSAGPPPAPPPQSASSVIHEYKLNPELAPSTGKGTAFTIALKDGSMRSAVAFWVQQGKLHYIDSHDRQQVLSADLIDRDATERLNREKNLPMQLPPI